MNRSALLSAALALLTAGLFNLRADDFYDALLREVGTNHAPDFSIKSPLLLDLHNTGPRLTNSVIAPPILGRNDQLLGLRLGMTMTQVFECWGKPQAIFVGCDQQPCLKYEDATVHFTPASQTVERVWVRKALEITGGQLPKNDFEECVRLLAEPDERKIDPDPFSGEALHTRCIYSCYATYLGTTAEKLLMFHDGEFVSVTLKRKSNTSVGAK